MSKYNDDFSELQRTSPVEIKQFGGIEILVAGTHEIGLCPEPSVP